LETLFILVVAMVIVYAHFFGIAYFRLVHFSSLFWRQLFLHMPLDTQLKRLTIYFYLNVLYFCWI